MPFCGKYFLYYTRQGSMQRLQTQVIVFSFLLKYIQNTNDKANSKKSQTKMKCEWLI